MQRAVGICVRALLPNLVGNSLKWHFERFLFLFCKWGHFYVWRLEKYRIKLADPPDSFLKYRLVFAKISLEFQKGERK